MGRKELIVTVLLLVIIAVMMSWGVYASGEMDSHKRAIAQMDQDYGAIRLVAYGCEGADGPLFAVEEDHLPECVLVRPLSR